MTSTTYRDADAPVEARVDDLIGQMTVREKVAQLVGIFPFALLGSDGVSRAQLEEHLSERQRSTVDGGNARCRDEPGPMVDAITTIQRYLVEETRLGVPAICHAEALSGLLHGRAANFPTAIALAATWDPGMIQAMTDVVRQQARALGIHQALSPVLDIARDARWGRVHETYGEDPMLCSAMGSAFVRGLQGTDLDQGVIATGKHFLGYGLSEGGRNLAAVLLSERELYEVFARPFEAAIRDADLAVRHELLFGDQRASGRQLQAHPHRAAPRPARVRRIRGRRLWGRLHAIQPPADGRRSPRCRLAGTRGRARRRTTGGGLLRGGDGGGFRAGASRHGRPRHQRATGTDREVPSRPLRAVVSRPRCLRRRR